MILAQTGLCYSPGGIQTPCQALSEGGRRSPVCPASCFSEQKRKRLQDLDSTGLRGKLELDALPVPRSPAGRLCAGRPGPCGPPCGPPWGGGVPETELEPLK